MNQAKNKHIGDSSAYAVEEVRCGQFESFTMSRVGEGCEVNEDYAVADQNAGIFVVTDGIGGRPRGDLASKTAADTFLRHLSLIPFPLRLDDNSLQSALAASDDSVRNLADSDPTLSGMGTTFSAAVINVCSGKIVHMGDSRIYRYRRPELRALTLDHTVAADMLRQKQISLQTAERSPLRNVLSRYLGASPRVTPDISEVDLLPEDVLLLVTDGLGKSLDDLTIRKLLDRNPGGNPRHLCEALMAEASDAGLRDNVTIMLVQLRN